MDLKPAQENAILKFIRRKTLFYLYKYGTIFNLVTDGNRPELPQKVKD